MANEGAALIQLIPVSELAPGAAGAIRNQVIQALLAQAAQLFRIDQSRLVVRDLRPTDLDFTPEAWAEVTGATASAYETWTTGTMADQRYVGIYGIRDDSPSKSVSLVKFNIGGADRAIWNLENLNPEDGNAGYSPSAVIIPPDAPYTISRYVVRATLGTHLIPKAVVVEPRGKLVSP